MDSQFVVRLIGMDSQFVVRVDRHGQSVCSQGW